MIIRQYKNVFTFINQHDHAAVSEKIVLGISKQYFPDDKFKDSAIYAVRMHDCGWSSFDKAPMWNDKANHPYSFIDYPIPIKTVLYKHGIDEIEKHDPYAALLCSKHYSYFISKDNSLEARHFLSNEEKRQTTIVKELDADDDLIQFHYELLQFADVFSLYLCLNNPGATKDETHPYFKNGIPLPEKLEKQLGTKAELKWIDETTLSCEPFLFNEPLKLILPQKAVRKDHISEKGLIKSFQETEETHVQLKII